MTGSMGRDAKSGRTSTLNISQGLSLLRDQVPSDRYVAPWQEARPLLAYAHAIAIVAPGEGTSILWLGGDRMTEAGAEGEVLSIEAPYRLRTGPNRAPQR